MIKLVLSDLDGTLLNDKKEVPQAIFGIYETLMERGVVCGVATGRSLASVYRDFPSMKDRMTIIAENGAVLYHNGTCIFAKVMNKEVLANVIAAIASIEGVHPVLCAEKRAYMLAEGTPYLDAFHVYYPHVEVVENLLNIDDDIVKIALYDTIDSEMNSYPVLKQFKTDLSITPSGKNWVDICILGIDKGNALQTIKKKLGLHSDECMAFGDFLNDVEMMKQVKYSYAVENAHQEVKSICSYTCASNENQGVVKTLQEVFKV